MMDIPGWLVGLGNNVLGALIVAGYFIVKEWRAKKNDENNLFEKFSVLMLDREKDLVARVGRLEDQLVSARNEIADLRLTLAKNNIDPDGDSHVE